MTDRTADLVSLPTWEECKAKVDADTATPLEAFIYENEPALTDKAQDFVRKCIPNYGRRADEQFRGMLADLIAYLRSPTDLIETMASVGIRQESEIERLKAQVARLAQEVETLQERT